MAEPGPAPRALVVTVVHPPEDARIRHREVAALVDEGWQVRLAAPYAAYGTPARGDVTPVELPRARGRRRLRALLAARGALRQYAGQADVVVLHDPELLLALPGLRLPPVVWDVHEDLPAALALKPWLPARLRRPVAAAARLVESVAERRVHLLLAEPAYRARFRRPHPVIPNTTRVPGEVAPPGDDRVVYVGALSLARGAAEVVAVGRRLREATGGAVTVEVLGNAHPDAHGLLTEAHARGWVRWHGYVPNDAALARLAGALAGLSLLHDTPNYRHSTPTKVVEYLAHGVPVVTTPLPLAQELVTASGGGVVVPFGDVETVASVVVGELLRLRADAEVRRGLGAAGHAYALAHLDWAPHAKEFVATLDGWRRRPGGDPCSDSASDPPADQRRSPGRPCTRLPCSASRGSSSP